MLKYNNLILAKHDGHAKTYVFTVPEGFTVKKGDRLIVMTSRGLQEATAACESFPAPDVAVHIIVERLGGYDPPAPAVAILSTVKKVSHVITVLDSKYQAGVMEYAEALKRKEED